MRAIIRVIDSISEWMGKIVRWLCVVLVLVMAYEVTMRYVFDAPTMWAYETSIMIGGSIFALGWAYVHRHKGHIRVDVFYERLSPKGKAIIDVIFASLFLFPLLIVLIDASVSYAWRAWLINEKSVETYWYPPAAPFRTVVAIGFCLFLLQCIAQFVRDLYLLAKNKPYD